MATEKKPAAEKSTARKTATKPSASKSENKKPAGQATPSRSANAAFMKPMTPSPALAAVIGAKPMPRTEVTKRLWDYIKAHNLQDPNNKRQINADAALKEVFGQPSATMFEMTKLVGKHLS